MLSAGAAFVPSRDLPSVHGRGGSRKDKLILIEEGLRHIAKALGALEGEEEHFWVDQDRHGQGEGEGFGEEQEAHGEDDYELRFTKDWLVGVTCLRWLPVCEGANEEDEERDDDGDEERTEEILRQAARLVAVCAGKSASGKSRRVYHFLADIDADRRDVAVRLEEQVLVEDALGARTWGAAPLLASLLLQKHLKHVIQHPVHSSGVRVLELGAGTGLVGLAVVQYFRHFHAKQAQVYLTDYHPDVLRNLHRNVELNECASSPAQHVQITVSALDWKDTPAKDFDGSFDLVVAADCVYEAEHAGLIKSMAEQYLCKREQAKLLLLSPLRPTHKDEIQSLAHEFPACPSNSRPSTAITPLRLCITHQDDLLGHDNFGPPKLQLTAQTVRLGGRSMRETGFRAYTIQWCAV